MALLNNDSALQSAFFIWKAKNAPGSNLDWITEHYVQLKISEICNVIKFEI